MKKTCLTNEEIRMQKEAARQSNQARKEANAKRDRIDAIFAKANAWKSK